MQAEGGVNAASFMWLRVLAELARRLGMQLFVDEVQTGRGHTGPFFSFEYTGIVPDIVCLAKSIGVPIALVLMRAEHDQWAPGEHDGTFRRNNPTIVIARAALVRYWPGDGLERGRRAQGRPHRRATRARRKALATTGTRQRHAACRGLVFEICPELAPAISASAFEWAMIAETRGE